MTEDLGDLLARGRAAIRRDEHRLALALFERAHGRDKNSVEALIGIALSASRLRIHDRATTAYLDLTEVSIRTNQLGLASKAIDRVLSRDPDNVLALRFAKFLRSRQSPEVELGGPSRLAAGTGDDWGSFFDKAPTVSRRVAALRPDHQPVGTFSDVETRQGSKTFIAALRRRSIGDLFSDNPTMPTSRRLLAELVSRSADPETAVADMQQLAGTPLEAMNDWDAATTVAVAAANLAERTDRSKKPHWNRADYPSFVDNDFDAPPRTIQIAGPGVVVAFAKLTRESPLLTSLGAELCQSLLAASEVVQSFAGQVVCRQGERQSSLFLIVTGQVVLERSTSGGKQHISTLSPGDFFGEDAVLGDTALATDARVTQDALLLEIESKLIKQLAWAEPRVLGVLSKTLRTRLVAMMLCDYPIFAQLGKASRRRLSLALQLHKAKTGGIIVGSGDANGLWFLISGRAERWDVNHSIDLRAPAAFGAPGQTVADVVATGDCWLLRLPPRDIRELSRTYPRLFDKLA